MLEQSISCPTEVSSPGLASLRPNPVGRSAISSQIKAWTLIAKLGEPWMKVQPPASGESGDPAYPL